MALQWYKTSLIVGSQAGNSWIQEKGKNLEFLNEVINVHANLLRFFLVDKMGYSLHDNYFLQERHSFLESAILYVFLHAREVVGKVQVAHDELNRYFDL